MDKDLDEFVFEQNLRSYKILGAHRDDDNNYWFRIWAPKAKAVSVVGDFNNWDKNINILELSNDTGIWSALVDSATEGDCYKFWILGADNIPRYKADPYAYKSELSPHDASILIEDKNFIWTDNNFWNVNNIDFTASPINIYEVHIGSWRKQEDGSVMNYRDIAITLGDYLIEMSYTHVLLLPILEYPNDKSYGFNATGYFSPSSRYGDKYDFKYFVNYLHELGIRVIINWLPNGFAFNDFGLANLDGAYCYEGKGDIHNYNSNSQVIRFDYSKPEVQTFLLSSIYYWINEFHLDGIQISYLSDILFTGNENSNNYKLNVNTISDVAANFIKLINESVHRNFKGVLTACSDASEINKVTDPLEKDGLGFDFKWDFGWMKDTLDYYTSPYEGRSSRHNKLTFSLMYNFHERFILALSHREVIDGYGALISKMPGDYWRQFASLRLLIIYMICHPGAKLLFMGGDIAQFIEWDYNQATQWFLLDYDMHNKYHNYVKNINSLYLNNKELWEVDTSWSGFTWLNSDDADNSVYSWMRMDKDGEILICIFNMTPEPIDGYKVPLPKRGAYQIIMNSDDSMWGGSDYPTMNNITETFLNVENNYFGEAIYGWYTKPYYDSEHEVKTSGVGGIIYSRDIANMTYEQSMKLNLPPLGALVLKYVASDPSIKSQRPWPDPELPYPKGFNPYNKAADEGYELYR